jgi:hypothetical protein
VKSRQLEGKTIRKVHQSWFDSTYGCKVWTLDAIEFTDGTFLRFVVVEGEGDYGIEPVYPGRSNYDPRDLNSIASECRRVVLAARAEIGHIPRAALLDLVADNLPDVPLNDLRAALVVAGVGY